MSGHRWVGRWARLVRAGACACAIGLSLLGRPARADQPPARETALVADKGKYSMGVFNPLRIAVTNRIELEAHPLVFLVSLNFVVRVAHVEIGDRLHITGEYGLSVPTLAMKLLQGHLFPSWALGKGRVGWLIAPRAGLVASLGDPWLDVVTIRVDLTVGVVLSHTDTMPLDTYAPLELLFAPVTGGYRGRVGAIYDRTRRLAAARIPTPDHAARRGSRPCPGPPPQEPPRVRRRLVELLPARDRSHHLRATPLERHLPDDRLHLGQLRGG